MHRYRRSGCRADCRASRRNRATLLPANRTRSAWRDRSELVRDDISLCPVERLRRSVDARRRARCGYSVSAAISRQPEPVPRSRIGKRRRLGPETFLQSCLDQGLGVGSRNEHAGTDREIEAPEFLVADDVGERFARQPRRTSDSKCAALDPRRAPRGRLPATSRA